MVSAIQNNIGAGLKEVGNYPYSQLQLRDEIGTNRGQLIYKLSESGKLNINDFAQSPATNYLLEPSAYPNSVPMEAGTSTYTINIPKLAQMVGTNPVAQLGPADMSLNVTVYTDYDDALSHKYTRVIKNRPYAVVGVSQDGEGNVPVYFFNLGATPFKQVTIRAVFDDPIKLMEEKDGIYAGEAEFPAPLGIQEMIIDILSDKYITYYRKLAHPNEPNDQTDKH